MLVNPLKAFVAAAAARRRKRLKISRLNLLAELAQGLLCPVQTSVTSTNKDNCMNPRITTIGLALTTLLLSGCIFAPGDHGDWDEDGRVAPTVGQELLDLDRARAAGLLSEAEYDRARDRILDR